MRSCSSALWLLALGVLLAAILRCSCQDSCFVAGTLVETPDGPRAIETLVAGDAVISVRVADGARFTRRVDAITTGVGYEFHTLTADGVTTHQMTATHPVFDARHGAFVSAADLADDAQLLNARGNAVSITGRTTETRWLIPQRVFNLSVEGPDHTFIADGVVVHNKSQIIASGEVQDQALCGCVVQQLGGSECGLPSQGADAAGLDAAPVAVCCSFTVAPWPQEFRCPNRGVRNVGEIGAAGAALLDLSGNQIANVSQLGSYANAPRSINLANNPIADIRDFSLSFGWCGSAPTIDLRGTLLDQPDLPDVERLRMAGCVVETSIP